MFTPVTVQKLKLMEEESYKNHYRVFSSSLLQDKELFPESRLRESFHVLRLSNRLCRLCHTVFSLRSHGRWVYSRENNGSRVAGTGHAGRPQMCQGPWQWRQGEGGGNSRAANFPFLLGPRSRAPVLHMDQKGGGHQHCILSHNQCCWYVGILQTESLMRSATFDKKQDQTGINITR